MRYSYYDIYFNEKIYTMLFMLNKNSMVFIKITKSIKIIKKKKLAYDSQVVIH